jgi:hypothetical protein
MENYKITKEQILAIEKVGGADVSLYLKETFPEVFKTELELNKWYKYKLALFYVTNKISNHTNYYNVFGFDVDGNWMTDNATTYFNENYIEATPEEVESALINEAKKRGYKKGVKCYFGTGKYQRIISTDDIIFDTNYVNNGGLCMGMNVIFTQGNWVEILPQEKTIVPMAKALKIIAKKMKVSPENIEIQY